MPIIEFKCEFGHVTEKLFLTFAAAEEWGDKKPLCPECKPKFSPATRIVSLPGKPLFLGDGWTIPGALGGKPTTVGGDPFKAAKEFAEENGAANIANAVKGAQ